MPDLNTKTPILGTSQKVNITSSSLQSTSINATYIDVTCSQPCWIAIGSNPTAISPTSYFMGATSFPYQFELTPGDKLAVIRDTIDGVLIICPVS